VLKIIVKLETGKNSAIVAHPSGADFTRPRRSFSIRRRPRSRAAGYNGIPPARRPATEIRGGGGLAREMVAHAYCGWVVKRYVGVFRLYEFRKRERKRALTDH